MGKLLLISFNLFIITISKLYFGGDVSVVEQLPKHAKPGELFEVKIEIEKGDREGFAKWQQSIPSGFNVTKGETDGGTFSFKNQEVKVIWMALPQAEKFVVTYTLQSEPSLSGEYSFGGKFSYIEENERKEVIIEKETILISANAPEMAEVIPPETDNTPPTEESTKQDTDLTSGTLTDTGKEIMTTPQTNKDGKQVLNNASVKIKRSITHISEGFYEIDLEINKNNLASFGKIEEFIPPNYTASSIENQEGIFSFSKNVMKIMWMTLPEGATINVTYGLQSTSNELDSADVFGVFSFLEVDQSKQLKLQDSRFRNYLAEKDILVDNSAEVNTDKMTRSTIPKVDDIIKQEADLNKEESSSDEITEVLPEGVSKESTPPVSEEIDSSDDELSIDSSTGKSDEQEEINKSSTTSSSNQANMVESITNIPSPETSISYRVQIAASKKEVQQQYFIDRHNITELVTIQSHEGWYKYTIGSYNVYKAARDKRNTVWGEDNKINDAFVTAYNEGIRISVQEALMVSKQKWYN